MSMNNTPSGERTHIGFFGRRNAGKSSIVNAVTGQDLAVVSDVKGTTTDPVSKAMELLPLGPVMIIDTPGFDDEGALGALRVEAARKAVLKCDIAIMLLGDPCDAALEREWHAEIMRQNVPLLLVAGKCDSKGNAERVEYWNGVFGSSVIPFSAVTGEGRDALLDALAKCYRQDDNLDDITYTLVSAGDLVVLVMPQDESAPKGRLIHPQVLTLRNLIDKHCIPLCCAPEELPRLLASLAVPPKLIITDSQIFAEVGKIAPAGTSLTSFSVLMARHKGDIEAFVVGAKVLRMLPPSAKVLIAEACLRTRTLAALNCRVCCAVKLAKSLLLMLFQGMTFLRISRSIALLYIAAPACSTGAQ